MIRLKDIAEKAGVSVMTVSKALRNKPDIAKATRTRIRAIADQAGYLPPPTDEPVAEAQVEEFRAFLDSVEPEDFEG